MAPRSSVCAEAVLIPKIKTKMASRVKQQVLAFIPYFPPPKPQTTNSKLKDEPFPGHFPRYVKHRTAEIDRCQRGANSGIRDGPCRAVRQESSCLKTQPKRQAQAKSGIKR